VAGSLIALRPPNCDQTATTLAGTPNTTATTCDHPGPLAPPAQHRSSGWWHRRRASPQACTIADRRAGIVVIEAFKPIMGRRARQRPVRSLRRAVRSHG
jgi:hypothetical protein